MEITFLGYCSNSFSSINTVSFILKDDDTTILFDCGPSITNNLHKEIKNFSEIEHIFISHGHFDHFLGLPYLLIGRHLDILAKRKKDSEYIPTDMHLYLPNGLKELISQLITTCHSDIKQLSYGIVYHDIEDSAFSVNGKIRVLPFRVDHSVPCFGFSVYENDIKVISYSSDTLYNQDIIAELSGSKYLIVEGMTPETEIAFSRKAKHATFNDMLDVVNSIRPDMAFVVHLQPRYLGEKESIINKMNSMSESEILFPEVGRKYVLRVYE